MKFLCRDGSRQSAECGRWMQFGTADRRILTLCIKQFVPQRGSISDGHCPPGCPAAGIGWPQLACTGSVLVNCYLQSCAWLVKPRLPRLVRAQLYCELPPQVAGPCRSFHLHPCGSPRQDEEAAQLCIGAGTCQMAMCATIFDSRLRLWNSTESPLALTPLDTPILLVSLVP